MARTSSDQPTELELQILRELWSRGDRTVRQIHDRLVELRGEDYAHASTMKMLHVMLEKELVTRDDSVRPQIFRSNVSEKRTQRSMLKKLVQRAYDGSTANVILHALSDKSLSKEEFARIREMLDQRERKS